MSHNTVLVVCPACENGALRPRCMRCNHTGHIEVLPSPAPSPLPTYVFDVQPAPLLERLAWNLVALVGILVGGVGVGIAVAVVMGYVK